MVQFLKQEKLLIVILIVAAILRLYHIDYQSLWLDEIHTINECNPALPFTQLYDYLCTVDPHPPLYFIYIRTAFATFGYTAFVMRFFTALLGIAGIWAIYLLGKEIYNKKVGHYAAILLTVNYFHISYSQDARPYALFFLLSTFSFYFLIRFIKVPTLKSSFLYGFFAALMLYSHLFSLFILVAQGCILLYFIYAPLNKIVSQKQFFIYCFYASIIIAILYIPCIKILLSASARTSMWIPPATEDAYTQIFKEMFGRSELVLYSIAIPCLLFVNKLAKTKSQSLSNKFSFSVFIVLIWLSIILLLPLIKSAISLPMIISRYFISILAPIIIIIAIGLQLIKNRVLQYLILALIILFCITDVVIIRRYYVFKGKTQFREAANFIMSNNKDNTPVISSLSWYLPFYLKNQKVNYNIIDKPLETYLQEMMADSTKIKPFWYIDGHGRPYVLSEGTQQFINKNLVITDNYDGFDVYTKHFTLLKDEPIAINIKKFGALKPQNGTAIQFSVEAFNFANNTVTTSGWVYYNNQDAYTTKIKLVLIKDGIANVLQTQHVTRPDVASYFKIDQNLDNCGFKCEQILTDFPKGTYTLGIYVIDKTTAKESLVVTDKIITIP